jgi:hypothetical protein
VSRTNVQENETAISCPVCFFHELKFLRKFSNEDSMYAFPNFCIHQPLRHTWRVPKSLFSILIKQSFSHLISYVCIYINIYLIKILLTVLLEHFVVDHNLSVFMKNSQFTVKITVKKETIKYFEFILLWTHVYFSLLV